MGELGGCWSSCHHWLHLIAAPTSVQQSTSASFHAFTSSPHRFILLSWPAEYRYRAPLSTDAGLISLLPNPPHPLLLFSPLCPHDHAFILLLLYLASALHKCYLGNICFFFLKCKLPEDLYFCFLVSQKRVHQWTDSYSLWWQLQI